MPLWTDIIDPVEATGTARAELEAYEQSKGTLARWLPNVEVDDIYVELVVGPNGLVDEALYRAFDAEPEIGRSAPGEVIVVKLPALSRNEPIDERTQLALRRLPDDRIKKSIEAAIRTGLLPLLFGKLGLDRAKEAVEQIVQNPFALFRIVQGIGRKTIQAVGEGSQFGGRKFCAFEQVLGDRGDLAVTLLFGQEALIVVEAFRVQQPQAGKVALVAELIRGGGQQQHAGDLFGQRLDDLVGAARRLVVPLQVVGLVDDQQIPGGGVGLVETGALLAQPLQAADHQLLGFERILGVVCRLDAALLVE